MYSPIQISNKKSSISNYKLERISIVFCIFIQHFLRTLRQSLCVKTTIISNITLVTPWEILGRLFPLIQLLQTYLTNEANYFTPVPTVVDLDSALA